MSVERAVASGDFVPCSPRHRHCSRSHAALVHEYRWERDAQLTSRDECTGGYPGDIKLWKENGNKIITFREWLIANANE